jgi:hypothetical protein
VFHGLEVYRLPTGQPIGIDAYNAEHAIPAPFKAMSSVGKGGGYG